MDPQHLFSLNGLRRKLRALGTPHNLDIQPSVCPLQEYIEADVINDIYLGSLLK